jgi:hypothetical protein
VDWLFDAQRSAASDAPRDVLEDGLAEYWTRLLDLNVLVADDFAVPAARQAELAFVRARRWCNCSVLDTEQRTRDFVLRYVLQTIVANMPMADRLRWAHLEAVLAHVMGARLSAPAAPQSPIERLDLETAGGPAYAVAAEHRLRLLDLVLALDHGQPPGAGLCEPWATRCRRIVEWGLTTGDAMERATTLQPRDADDWRKLRATTPYMRASMPCGTVAAAGPPDLEDLDQRLPPCFAAVVKRGRTRGHLKDGDRFPAAAFLASLGMRDVERAFAYLLGAERAFDAHHTVAVVLHGAMRDGAGEPHLFGCRRIRKEFPTPTDDRALHCPFDDARACARGGGLPRAPKTPADFVKLKAVNV